MASERSIMIREATVDDWNKIVEVYRNNSSEPPSPGEKFIIMEEAETGKVVGLLTANTVPHLGPIWVAEEYRHQGYGTGMILFAEQNILNSLGLKGYYMFPSNEHCSNLCKKNGMKKLDWEIWLKEF